MHPRSAVVVFHSCHEWYAYRTWYYEYFPHRHDMGKKPRSKVMMWLTNKGNTGGVPSFNTGGVPSLHCCQESEILFSIKNCIKCTDNGFGHLLRILPSGIKLANPREIWSVATVFTQETCLLTLVNQLLIVKSTNRRLYSSHSVNLKDWMEVAISTFLALLKLPPNAPGDSINPGKPSSNAIW